jgi:hypothetical protein
MPPAALPLAMDGPRPSDRFRLRRSNTYLNQRISFTRNENRNSVKQWNSLFFGSTAFTEQPFVKAQQKIRAVGDILDIFLRGSGSPKQSWISDVVKRFCRENHATAETAQDDSARAWLDDRDLRTGHKRAHPKWQTAQELRSELEKPVCDTLGTVFEADSGIAFQFVWRA